MPEQKILNENNASVKIYNNGSLVSSGAIIFDAHLNAHDNDEMHISNGGVANNTSMSYYGSMSVFSGGIANNTSVGWIGAMHISNGGVASNTTVNSGGSMYISNGGVASNTTVNSGGSMYISNGGVANRISINSGGYMYVFRDGVANDTVVYYGYMHISNGGITNSTIVNRGGSLYVSSGGTATNIIWTPCVGGVTVAAGAYVTYANQYSGVYFGYRNQLLSSAMTMDNKIVSGSMYVMSGGEANSTTVDGGSMFIANGGIANNTTVSNGGFYISSGGEANSTTIFGNDARMYVCNNCEINSTVVSSGGKMYISSGGMANDVTVKRFGSMFISSGGTATNVIWTPCVGSVYVADGAYVTYASQYSGVYFGSGQQLLSSTMIMDNKVVSGTMYVMSGGETNNTIVNSSMCIFNGGTANSTTVSGVLHISCGGFAKITDVYAGMVLLHSGGTASLTTIKYGSMTISNCGVADDTIVNTEGVLHISHGGVANSTMVNSSGSMYILRGGVADSTTMCGGRMYVSSGGVANNTTISSGFLYILRGGVANNTTISGGFLSISSGGIVNKTTMNYNGSMSISDGGVANNTIMSLGEMYISSGGIHSGHLKIENGVIVSAYQGAIIDFTVAEQKSADTALINDISRISGNSAVYTLTVAEDQASGDYVLAGNAAAFDKTITVKTDEAELGKLAVGDNFTVGGVVYSLHLVDSNLTLTLDGPPELDVTVSQKESLDYEFVVKISEPASLQYKINNGEWQDADGTTIAIAQNGTYSIRAIDAAENVSNIFTKEISGLVFGNPEKVETDGGKTSWTPVKDAEGNVQQVVVQYSMDNFKTVVTIVTSESELKLWSLPDNVQWRVKGKNDPEWEVGEEIAAEKNVSAPQKIESVADGVTDIFFARTAGRWTILHQARHQGIKGGWTGTQEIASLGGKSKIVDVFRGAADVDILYLTDQGNGDVLFVDDIYADSFEGIAKTQARIANLDEIRAGAGDDVVDMTSQRFAYVGDGVTIYGGDGDDVIWSNKGDNKLFGDAGDDNIIGASGNDVIVGGAGDDRMHGGGGDDIFCFGSDWGIDTVEQLSGGTVTLWFEDGSEGNWNADTRTYSDGENTVTVSGTADVTLNFGGDISSLPEGIFSNAVTKKIFESTLA